MTRRDAFIDEVEQFLDEYEGPPSLPGEVRDAVLAQLPTTPQSGPLGLRRYPHVNSHFSSPLPFALVAAAVAAVALLGALFVFDGSRGVGDDATPTLSPAALLASGTFSYEIAGGTRTVELDATEQDGAVVGRADITHTSDPPFSIDLSCTRTTEDGIFIVGGEVVDSEDPSRAEGERAAVIIAPGDPSSVIVWGEDPPPAADCSAFLEALPADMLADEEAYRPITDGAIDVGP